MFSAATTRMQSAGQAAAQSEQPTHFSSPFSWTMETVPAAEARVERPLLLRVLLRQRLLEDLPERDGEALDRANRVHADPFHTATTTIAVTTAFSVATGRRIFQPNCISWS